MFTDGVPVSFRTPLPNGDAVAASKLTPLPVFHHAMDCSLPFCTKFVGDALSPASSWMSSMYTVPLQPDTLTPILQLPPVGAVNVQLRRSQPRSMLRAVLVLLRSTPGIVTACPLEFMRIGSMYESASQSLTM